MRVGVAADQAGFELKQRLVEWLKASRCEMHSLSRCKPSASTSAKIKEAETIADATSSATACGMGS